jgi:hypothetical protein
MNETEYPSDYHPGRCAICDAVEPKGGLIRRQLPVGIVLVDEQDRVYRTGAGEYAWYCRLDGDCRRRRKQIEAQAEEGMHRFLADPDARHALLRNNHNLIYRINADGTVTQGRELLAEVLKGQVPEGGVYRFNEEEELRRLTEYLDGAFKKKEARDN